MLSPRTRRTRPLARRRLGVLALWAAAAALLGAGCGEEKESRIERRHRAFKGVATLVYGPIDELRPFHDRIAEPGGGDVVLLDARWEACQKAAPIAARIADLPFPPDEEGKPLKAVETVRQRAGRFAESIRTCGGGQPGAAPPPPDPTCIARCVRDWSSLTHAVARLRYEAQYVGARVQPLAPPPEAE